MGKLQRARSLGWWLGLLGVGCFAESPSASSGESGGACPIGTNGCPCDDAGQCEGDLACHAPSSNCYAPMCTLGSADCPCVDGQCLGELSCVDDFCESPGGGNSTTGTGSGMSTTLDPTGTPTSDSSTTSSGPSLTTTTTDPSTSDPTDPNITTIDTFGTTSFDDGCKQCLMMAPMECTCELCANLADCYYGGATIEECCTDFPNEIDGWNGFVTCATTLACFCEVDPLCG